MFQELMPLLEKRVLILTMSRVGAEEICVNVIPKPLKAADREENSATRTPLSLTGTPQELDREMPRQLTEFVDSHLQLSSTLQMAKVEMEAAAKAAQEAAKKSAASKLRANTKSTIAAETHASGASSAAENAEAAPSDTPSAATTGSLFETVPGAQT